MVERLYTEIADYYDLFLILKDYKHECDFVVSHIDITEHTYSILELGCGTGNHLLPFEKSGFHVTGIDKSPQMLAHARKKCPTAKLIKADFTTNWAKDINASFDCIVCLGTTIAYAHGYDKLVNIIQQAEMVLRKGGIFAFDLWKYLPCETGSEVEKISIETENIELLRATEWSSESEVLVSKDCFIIPTGKGHRVIFDVHTLYLFDVNRIIKLFLDRGWNISIFSGFTDKDFEHSDDRAVFVAKRT